MYFYLYKITNLLNNKFYIGVHSTKNLDDGYMGSGKRIRAAINKYGLENFKKDILEYFESSTEMFLREKEIVTNEFLMQENSYNLCTGGFGGFNYINSNKLNDRTGCSFSDEQKKNIGMGVVNSITDDERRRRSELMKGNKRAIGNKGTPGQKTAEHIEKIRKSLKGKGLGIKQDLISCPHCGKIGGSRAIKRYHFDRCKMQG